MKATYLIVHKNGNAQLNITADFIQRLTTIESDDVVHCSGEHSYMIRFVFNPDRSDIIAYQMNDMKAAYAVAGGVGARINEYLRVQVSPEASQARALLERFIQKYPDSEINDMLEALMELVMKLN